MLSSLPSKLQDYYIAYFDILGYKDFFKTQHDKVPELLNMIHGAIQRTKNHLNLANKSPIMNGIGKINIRSKVFSDNVFLCMEVMSEKLEQVRLLAFLQIISEIQRGFVNEYGLFVRGSILKGEISFNDDYVFGQGLIDAVQIEERAQYPRIVIDKELISFLKDFSLCSKEAIENADQIKEKINQRESITSDEQTFYSQFIFFSQLQMIFNNEIDRLAVIWPDEICFLNYLYLASPPELLLGEEIKESMLQLLHTISPSDFQLLQQPIQEMDKILMCHKTKVEEKLRKYGNNLDIAVGEVNKADLREKILRKYVWVMAFHNRICDCINKSDYKICTKCNCDTRFLKMTIEVL